MSGRTVWLASYPKSGNTWLRAVYSAWRSGADPDLAALGTIASSRERFDDALGLGSSDLTPAEIERLRAAADDVVDGDFGGPHLQKVHDRLGGDPAGRGVVSAAATRAAIYVIRDPRDVAVSLAHHNDSTLEWAVERLNDPHWAISDRTDDVGDQLFQRLGTWSDHVRSWVDGALFPVHVIRYEDGLADPEKEMTKVLVAAGFEVGAGELAGAIARSSFARLREREAQGGFREGRSRSSPFFRRGEAGGWRGELPAPLAQRVAADHAEVMGRFGYLDPPAR